MRPIEDVARDLGLTPDEVEPWGRGVAKVDPAPVLARARAQGRLVLVTAITPTSHGEGKTTVLVGLLQAMRRLGARACGAVRQPTLGPVFGLKGGGNGGGASQVVPRDRFDLHLTGDSHAVQAAHNLAAAYLDEHVHRDGPLAIAPGSITWPRALDLCDRALRRTVVGLGPHAGPPREVPWVITAASEVMAVLALARDPADLRARLGRVVVARRRAQAGGGPVTLDDLRVAGAMTALLRDAARPNLLQTSEGAPVLAHAGPFANVAHGCSSVIADRVALAAADWVVTEAGFGADLGAEKFFDIVCRQAELRCAAAVVVATVRALEAHGHAGRDGAPLDAAAALRRGLANLVHHVQVVRRFGVPVVVAVNAFEGDRREDLDLVAEAGLAAGAFAAAPCHPFDRGGEGCEELARAVMAAGDPAPAAPSLLYQDELPLARKLEAIATAMYGAEGLDLAPAAAHALERLEAEGHGRAQVCVAKTPLSLGHDPTWGGLPRPFRLEVREVALHAGAGFVTAVAGDLSLMPGLPPHPRGEAIDLDPSGAIVGL